MAQAFDLRNARLCLSESRKFRNGCRNAGPDRKRLAGSFRPIDERPGRSRSERALQALGSCAKTSALVGGSEPLRVQVIAEAVTAKASQRARLALAGARAPAP